MTAFNLNQAAAPRWSASGSAPAVRALAAAAIAVCLGMILTAILRVVDGSLDVKHTDFISYYSAGVLASHGNGAWAYAASHLSAVERGVIAPFHPRGGVLPYLYPPYFLVALAPFARLPLQMAFELWAALNLAVLLAALVALHRFLRPAAGEALFLWLGALSFLPVLVCLLQGQVSILLLGLLTAVFFAAREKRDVTAGVLLALVLIKPPLVLPFLVLFAVRRRWKLLGAFTATACVLGGMPELLFGAGINAHYLQTLEVAAGWHGQFGFGAQFNDSIAGFAQLLLPAGPAAIATAALDLAVAGALISRCRANFEAAFALATVAALLVSPHVLIHDLSLLLLPAALAFGIARRAQSSAVPVLVALDAAAIAGLVAVHFIPLQLAVPGMALLAGWLMRQPALSTPEVVLNGC